MSVDQSHIDRVRGLSGADPTEYSDSVIEGVIEMYKVRDGDGLNPGDTGYVDTYDLFTAAAEIVERRSAAAAAEYDVNADGSGLMRSQVTQQLNAVASRLRARGVVTLNEAG